MGNDKVLEQNKVILYCDIHNFSNIFGRLKDKLAQYMQDYYYMVGEIVIENDGEIVNYIGDGVLTIFPEGSEIDAVKAALLIRKAFNDLKNEYPAIKETELEVGITSGNILMGKFGHKSLKQKNAFGIKINEAAMIIHNRGISITQEILSKISGIYKTTRGEDLKVKWNLTPIKVWKIVEE